MPDQHDYRNPVVELNPKRLGRWLKELPVMNLCACLGQVLDALGPCNLQSMAGKNRIRLLELYRDMVTVLFEAVDDEHLARLPISAEQRQAAREQAGLLCNELANGYKILVRECLQADAPARQALLAPALFRALEATTRALLHSYRTYQPAPSFAYLELHRLYTLAERTAVADAAVVLDKQTLSEDGIGALYRHALMMAVADPYRLGTGIAARLFPLLAPYAPACRLEPYTEGVQGEGCFVVDRGANSPPAPTSRAHSDYGYEQPLLLDVRPALASIKEWLEASAEDSPDEARLLQLLVPEPQRARVRQAPRREVRRDAWVTFGIPAVHHFLARGAAHIAETIRTAGASFQVRDLESEPETDHALQPWAVVNESVSGYLLASRDKWLGDPRVGELVGMVVPGANSQPRMTVAAVRWMRAARDQRVEMGVEIIPGTPRPIRCSASAEDPVAGLFFPSAPALQLPATLALPTGTCRTGALIDVHTGERVVTVRAANRVTATECFERFDFESL